MSSPYTHEIRVTWGDCDPAQIVYTARIPCFALDAINAWWEDRLGQGWYQLELDRGLGTPFVHMSLDFRHPITPRHRLLCRVWPARLGETSIDFRVDGEQGGKTCFEGRFTCVFVEAAGFAKTAPPPDIRDLVQAHLPRDAEKRS
ncbi:acyl-CoA thioesterase [Maliponia aquimaris]|uniref:Thioesterase superfamily protein n=1 Tax=Maliponia aquimaris TaxID=1673631 RepID=A0A238L5D3_9RHOB|nr:thioesterase family protein [Maliponia aquimaris]SMX50207.1 Thioesterase superfamily protein [Maliponia aquimaris]